MPWWVFLSLCLTAWAAPFMGDRHSQQDSFLSKPELSFLTVGDWGCGRRSMSQLNVAKQMGHFADKLNISFVVSVGDNFYPHGIKNLDDEQIKTTFQQVYTHPLLSQRWFAVAGNHDHHQNISAQVALSERVPQWYMPALYFSYSFLLQPASATSPAHPFLQLVFIDTQLLIAGDAQQYQWLADTLDAATADFLIVVGHSPVYSGGSHGSNGYMMREVKPLFDKYRVSAYFFGHDHNLQHLLEEGVHYIGSGSGCKSGPKNSVLPQTVFTSLVHGFTTNRIRGNVLEIQYVDDMGTILHTVSISARSFL
eukprot:TRINITY_DN2564_c0_g1_i1.p1 TRINITY_DN2564_c0_g1~~TRINITY_DN2564_c0_g1_i1.p1  ORF type:complete len:309 (-),score=63.82 TRINITY_DN2564_c0_g1_i1:71-997(-)